jgi:hypothetical protein
VREGEVVTSDNQAEANRRNPLKSTGPRTPEGKAAICLNAIKHVLLSMDVLVPGEDEAALKELGERLRDELQPAGELEGLLVELISAASRGIPAGRPSQGGNALSPACGAKSWKEFRSLPLYCMNCNPRFSGTRLTLFEGRGG